MNENKILENALVKNLQAEIEKISLRNAKSLKAYRKAVKMVTEADIPFKCDSCNGRYYVVLKDPEERDLFISLAALNGFKVVHDTDEFWPKDHFYELTL